MKEIPLSKGKIALVDDENYDEISQFKWCFNRYALRFDKGKHVYMHRIISKCPKGLEVDHKNGNKLDNRRANLRICTRQQNTYNVPLQRNSTTGFKGVNFHKGEQKYRACLTVNQIQKHLGYFTTKEAAHAAYKIAVIQFAGEFSRFQ